MTARTRERGRSEGDGRPGSYAPQAPLTVTPTVTTVLMPFSGPGAPPGGSPAIGVDTSHA